MNSKAQIVKYILQHGSVMRSALVNNLGLSTPTVLARVKELIADGIICEVGTNDSKVGRKAKVLSVVADHKFSIGVDITGAHVTFVMVDLCGNVRNRMRLPKDFRNSIDYCMEVAEEMRKYINAVSVDPEKILGVSVALPGILDRTNQVLLQSHALHVQNFGLKIIESALPYPAFFSNDANAAAVAETMQGTQNAVYLSLSNTVGGALILNGQLVDGMNHRAGEFGHMILTPHGKKCYCGKLGCSDAYLNAKVLSDLTDGNLERFFYEVKSGNPEILNVFHTYLDDLAVLVSNLRVAYDLDVVLGGYVGGLLEDYLPELGKRLLEINQFDADYSYVKIGHYKHDASAAGAATYFIDKFISELN